MALVSLHGRDGDDVTRPRLFGWAGVVVGVVREPFGLAFWGKGFGVMNCALFRHDEWYV